MLRASVATSPAPSAGALQESDQAGGGVFGGPEVFELGVVAAAVAAVPVADGTASAAAHHDQGAGLL